MSEKMMGQVRALLSAAAGIAASVGWVSEDATGWIVSAGLYLVTAYWSWKSKK